MQALPEVDVGPEIEGYAQWFKAVNCLNVAQPGVVSFRDWVMGNLGGGDLGIVRTRNCDGSSILYQPSSHNEGRAWDWRVSADDPGDVAMVDQFVDWLIKTDKYGNQHANWRRLGLNNLIWDHRSYRPSKGWRDYTGLSPHTDHVHFSFGWPGARGETSFFEWLHPSEPPTPLLPKVELKTWLWPGLAVGIGAVAGFVVYRRIAA